MNQSQGTSEEDLHLENTDKVQAQLQQLNCEPTVSPHGQTQGINLNATSPISAASGQPGKIKIEIGGQQMDEPS